MSERLEERQERTPLAVTCPVCRARQKLNAAVYRALVPGGVYVIADHAAPPGAGLAAARQENRIEDRKAFQRGGGWSICENGAERPRAPTTTSTRA